jgi:translocation and assembly module TamB
MNKKLVAIRVARYFTWTILALIVVITALVATGWGNRLLIRTLHQVEPNISLSLKQGALFNNPVFEDIAINLPAIKLNITKLTLDWDWSCLTQGGFCIDEITIDAISLEVAPSPEEPEPTESSTPPLKIELPLWLKLNNFTINQLEVSVSGHQLSWQQLQLALQFYDSTLVINDLTLTGLTAKLAAPKALSTTQPAAQAITQSATPPATSNKNSIQLPEISLPLAIVINRLAVLDTTIIQGDKVEKIDSVTLDANAKQHDIVIEQFTITHSLADIKLKGKLALNGHYPLAFTSEINTKPAFKLGENTIDINLTGQLNELISNIAIKGEFDATFDSHVDVLDPALPFKLAANWQKFAVPTFTAQKSQITVQKGKLEASGSLDKIDFSLATGVVGVQIPPIDIVAQGYTSLEELTLNKLEINTLNGQINSTATINWSDALSWQAKLNLANIEPHHMWPAITANLNGDFHSTGEVSSDKWQVALDKLNLNGQWQKHPLSLSGKILGHSAKAQSKTQPYGVWQLEKLRLNNGSNSLLVNGRVDQNIALKAEINAKDLSQSLPELAGSLSAKLQLSGKTTSPNITLMLDGNSISVASQQLNIGRITANGKLATSPSANNQLELKLTEIQAADQQIEQAKLIFNGSWLKHQASLSLISSFVTTGIALDGGYKNQQWQGRLLKSNIESDIGKWAITQPVAIAINTVKQQVKIAQHCWQQQAGPRSTNSSSASSSTANARLCLTQAATVGAKGKVELALNDFNFSQLSGLLPPQASLEGQIKLIADASWQPNVEPRLNATITSTSGKISISGSQGDFITHYNDLRLKVSANKTRSLLDFSVDSPEIGQIKLTANTEKLQPNSPLSGELELSAIKLNAFNQLAPQLDRLNGEINAKTTIGGTLQNPLIYGEIKLTDGLVTGLTLPAQIEQLTATVKLKGNKADIDSSFMLGQGQGQIAGQLRWQPELTGNLTIRGSALTVAPTSDISITFSPDIKINYTKDQLAIGGNLSVDKGKVKINKLPESAVALSDDVVIVTTTPPPPENKLALRLDLEVLINEKFKVDAFGLTSSLAGQLKLSQTRQTPLTGHGELNLVDAKYAAMGQHLDIRRGKILFTGSLSQPLLNIEAIREPNLTQDDVIAGINITGSPRRPSLTIFSEPAMSQQEAISYLLRGRPINSEDSANGESMLIGMLLSSGIEGSGDLVNDIGNSMGISDMSFNTKGSGDDTAVEVSGYIAPNIELRYAVGVFDSQPELTIRYQLMPKLFVDIITGTDEALDLLYMFDFD